MLIFAESVFVLFSNFLIILHFIFILDQKKLLNVQKTLSLLITTNGDKFDSVSRNKSIEFLNLNDTIIEIENTTITNRPDLFSHV